MKYWTTTTMIIGLVCGSASLFADSPVEMDGRWYNFKTVQGVDFGAGVGYAYNHTSSVPNYYDPGPPAWTFTAPGSGATITVLDGGEVGDVYDVFDFGTLIGTTSPAVQSAQICGDQPQTCETDPRVSKGTFSLAPGPHSIKIAIRSTPYPNSYLSWFRVQSGGGGQPSALPILSSVITAAGGADAVQTKIEAGSWASITGTDLAGSTVLWNSVLVNGQLPTTLGGVSVTVDGKAAFMYYVSPTQINFQVPASSLGSVPVVVTTQAGASAPIMAMVETHAPSFFQWGKYAVATRFPDYRLVANPSLGIEYVAARPGDTIVLWATGLGPVTPSVVPGVPVATASTTLSVPTVTVGGLQATVIGTAVSPGLVGVYQIAIVVPNVSVGGDTALHVSIGGYDAPGNTYLYIEK